MKSAIVLTQEIDDLNVAVDELTSGIRDKIAFGRSSVGIVYCDADVDVAELGRLLHENLGFDIVGLTTTALIERYHGYCDMGIALAVLTGDDVDISIGNTGELSKDDFAERIGTAYSHAREALPEDPKLILLCAPYIADLTSENYVEVLDEVSGHVPVFGGVATDHYDLQHQKTFYNGAAYRGALQFLLISGNIKPVFAMEHYFGGGVDRKGIITQSSGNLVERVGDKTFKEFLSEMTPVPDDESVIYYFQSTPFIMELPDYEESEQPVVRALCTIDHTTGAGGFLSKMPEGSRLSINVLQRENLSESCNGTLDRLVGRMKQNPGYEYSLILISTCNARHLLMGDAKELEANIVADKFSEFGPEVCSMGFYAFGEMCPTISSGEGKAKNRFHNVSFAACAF